jgi:endonuclease/exonuclease/phosphatase family metal-dependent hydrolase
MRLATFNVENLDTPVTGRAAILRPALERLEADVLCLQEVNGQHVPGHSERKLLALDALLEGTEYATFNRAWTTSHERSGPADVHNLVTLSRYPIVHQAQIRHNLLPPLETRLVTAEQSCPEPTKILFDRPLLRTDLKVEGNQVTIINVHLRSPLATAIPGQKLSPFTWKSVSAWAEGYTVSAIKRIEQSLELRLLLDDIFTRAPQPFVLVAGDFNAEDNETPLRIAAGAPEDTGNSELTARSMVILDRAIDKNRRFSILHHGRPQMVDHILASHAAYGCFRTIEVHNEALGDEAVGYAKGVEAAGSYHAAVVATFMI